MAGYTYKKNSFYIEAEDDTLNDPISFTMLLNADTFSTKKEFETAINLDHELNHYVQDLFINACITEGFFRDYLAVCASELSKIDGVRFPLADSTNAKYNKALNLNSEDTEMIKTFYEIFEVYDYIYRQDHFKPKTGDYYYSAVAEPSFDKYSLKYIHLLETYAYHKAYWDFFARNDSGNGAEILHQIIKDNNVYPITWHDNNYEIQNFKHFIEWNERYQLVNFMMTIGLPYLGGASNQDYLDYCEKSIPYNYRQSPALFAHSAQKIILETALNIPSFDFIMSSVTKKEYDKEVFSPVHRFYKILKNIRDFHGYPDAVPGEDFFITFFNWVAKQNGWPTYQETHDSILSMLYKRASYGKEAITNYQFCAVHNKNMHYGRFVHDIPFETLSFFNLPLLVRIKNRLVIIQFMNKMIVDNSVVDFYQIMFGTENVIKYKDLTPDMDKNEFFETVFNNGHAALREILYRLFSNAAYKAFVEKGKFSCPLHELGCPCSVEKCKSFTHFKNVFDRCELKIFRSGSEKAYLHNGFGNVPDCMFFNYLIDYKYNINVIQNKTN